MIHRFSVFFCSLCLFITCAKTPITGKSALLLLSESDENKQGEDAYREILSKEKKTTNKILAGQVRTVGEQISEVANKPDYQWEFHTLDSTTPNAFCLPGGKVAIYTGIVPYLQNEAGLAAVMGHEIGHALARHGGQRISESIIQGAVMAGAALAISQKKSMSPLQQKLVIGALGAGATVGIVLPFSRSQETEADEIGLILMARAGYDPREAVAFWGRFGALSKGAPPEFLSTHPASSKRKEYLQSILPKALVEYEKAPRKYGAGGKLSY